MKDFENLSERDMLILLLHGIGAENENLIKTAGDQRNSNADRDIAKLILQRNMRASAEIHDRLKEVEE